MLKEEIIPVTKIYFRMRKDEHADKCGHHGYLAFCVSK